ncbi:beta-N-acetylhexosaminidase [Pseudothermotoga sp. U03pept]|uniref:beta-N-acetylhexosaminidase n=1 Tax=Pseudothermotoga sp. U03pept TaxID=3447012 RepID=UPI003EFBFEFA
MLPQPRRLVMLDGECELPLCGKILTNYDSFTIASLLKSELAKYGRNFSFTGFGGSDAVIKLIIEPSTVSSSQGYKIKITRDNVVIIAKTNRGLFYGLQTFKQLVREYGCKIPAMVIEDEPDFKNRGFMLDVSRDRIPNMQTLKALIDLLAELKYNEFQLYFEHTFAYEGHERVWKGYSPFTAQEILELDRYCKDRFIELVPNQNSFGHLGKWLKHEEYKYLAECPEGFTTPWGEKYGSFSLCPTVPESITFLESLFDQLLPNFTSAKVNIGGDETYDLGLGRSKEICERLGKGKVYLDFLLRIYKLLKRRGKTMMFWGDIIKNYPELVVNLPDDLIALIWGYESNHPYEHECRLFSERGVTFYVCPGTSSWNSFVGRSDNAIANISSALLNGSKYGAIGFLLTDWGDNGHPQHLPFSMIPLGYASTIGWNISSEITIGDLLRQVDIHLFKTNLPLAEDIYMLGTLYKSTNIQFHNMSPYFMSLVCPHKMFEHLKEFDKEDTSNIRKAVSEAENVIKRLLGSDVQTDLQQAIAQVINNTQMLILGMRAFIFEKEYNSLEKIPDQIWHSFKEELNKISQDYTQIWLNVNRPGGLNQSLEKLTRILKMRV